MSHEADSPPDPPDFSETPRSHAEITFDLRDMLTAGELEKFHSAAVKAEAPTLTEHFLKEALNPKQQWTDRAETPRQRPGTRRPNYF